MDELYTRSSRMCALLYSVRTCVMTSQKKYGFGRSKLGVPGHIYPDIKGQWLNWSVFLKMAKGEIGFF